MDISAGRKAHHAGKRNQKTFHRTGSTKTLIFLLLSFLSTTISAQTGQLEVSATDNQEFFIALDDSLVSNKSARKHIINRVPYGEHSLWIVLDRLYINQRFDITLTEEKRYIFQVGFSDGKLSLLPVGLANVDTVSKVIRKPVKKGASVKPEPVYGRTVPGITLDSLLFLGQMQDYSGKLGCRGAYGDLSFRESVKQIKLLDFESERLSV
ncbi:MAG: hypothetical protein V4616_13960, partial [Bacteroidota bacterium]